MSMLAHRSPGLVAPLAVLALLGAGCSGKDNGGAIRGSGSTVTTAAGVTAAGAALRTVAAGKITACTSVPKPPYEFEDQGKVVGVDADVLRAVTGRLGLQADFHVTPAGGALAALRAGACDVVVEASPITSEGQKDNDFSAPYIDVVQSLLVRASEITKVADLPSLAGKTIGAQSGTAGAAYAHTHTPSGAVVKEYATGEELVAALKASQVDGAVVDEPVGLYYANAGGVAVSKRFDDQRASYAVVLPKGAAALKTAVDNALRQIRADDTYMTILRSYLGADYGKS